jgi:hypothetical protein
MLWQIDADCEYLPAHGSHVHVKLPLIACVLASGCYAWPIVKGPTPGAGCVQVTVRGRQRYYWKNLGELERARLANALADFEPAARAARAAERNRRAAVATLIAGMGLVAAGAVGVGLSYGLHARSDAGADVSFAIAGGGGALAIGGTWIAAELSDRKLREAVIRYDGYADTAGCSD